MTRGVDRVQGVKERGRDAVRKEGKKERNRKKKRSSWSALIVDRESVRETERRRTRGWIVKG